MKRSVEVAEASPRVKRNDLSIYHTYERAWWDAKDPTFMPLRALAPARLRFLERHLPSQLETLSFLDLGCGGGYLALPLAKRGARVTGLDRAEGALNAARAQAQVEQVSLSLIHGDAQQLPFETASFDVVLCTDVLVHVPEPAGVIAEIARVLRPDGWLYFSTLNRTLLARLLLITLAEDWLKLVPRGTHDPDKFIRPEELDGFLGQAGLVRGRTEGLGPVGIRAHGMLKFGYCPSRAVMYHGVARKRDAHGTLLQNKS